MREDIIGLSLFSKKVYAIKLQFISSCNFRELSRKFVGCKKQLMGSFK